MATYAIGDVQGCYYELQKLLDHIHFDPSQDTLWFTGDLVNRGSHSLETLRFIKQLGDKHRIVLGNHDLHLLALGYHVIDEKKEDTLSAILQAPDKNELMNWLLRQPLLHHDATLGFTMVHAGLAPDWDLAIAQRLSNEVSSVLQRDPLSFFQHMYGNFPDYWTESHHGWERLRCITNFFTRVRFCHSDGRLNLSQKGKMSSQADLIPWFQLPQRKNANLKIIFGHWAALQGITNTAHVFALDTGCVWGYALTAMRLEDEKRFCVGCDE